MRYIKIRQILEKARSANFGHGKLTRSTVLEFHLRFKYSGYLTGLIATQVLSLKGYHKFLEILTTLEIWTAMIILQNNQLVILATFDLPAVTITLNMGHAANLSDTTKPNLDFPIKHYRMRIEM